MVLALGVAMLGSALAMDRTRIASAVLFWPVLDQWIGNPETLESLRGRDLKNVMILWALWPFTYVWENHLLLPWLGFRTLPFP